MVSAKTRKILKEVRFYLIVIAAALFVRFVFLINAYTPSGSMEPTIPTESRHMGLKCAYWFSEPERGDIIIFAAPDDPETEYVKRVIGLPGETVEIRQGVTYIDGVALDEPYLKETPAAKDFGPYVVPEESVFVMGDNRNNSWDARYWTHTYVAYDMIMGKAYFTYWPSIAWLY